MPRESLVPRPTKKTEYVVRFATTQAEKGWRDLVATIRNPMSETWDFLTRTPHAVTPTNYPLQGPLGQVTRGGQQFPRWQHKPTLGGTARIWFYVDARTVFLEQVHTARAVHSDVTLPLSGPLECAVRSAVAHGLMVTSAAP